MAKQAVVVAFALAAAASTAGGSPALVQVPAGAARTAVHATVLGLLEEDGRTVLTRLDARRLRPVGRRIVVGGGGGHAFSPNGRTLVVASAVTSGPSADRGRSMLSFVDLRRMRRTARLELRASGLVGDIVWSRPRRLAVLLDDPPRVVAVGTRPLRAGGARRLPGRVVATDSRAGRLAVLLAPRHSIGSSRLAVVKPDGRVRTVALPAIRSGWERVALADDPRATRQRIPGLAVSPDGARALVVPAGDRVADVDLDSLRVSHQDLSERVSFLVRLSSWLEPAAEAKTVEGPDRFARWVRRNQVAVTGMTYGRPRGGAAGSRAGLRLIDTRDWRVRTLAGQAAGMVVVGDLVLAYAWASDEAKRGIGLRAYGPDGRERFHLFRNRPVDWVDASFPYAYVPRPGGLRFDVVDLRSGRAVGVAGPAAPVSLLPR